MTVKASIFYKKSQWGLLNTDMTEEYYSMPNAVVKMISVNRFNRYCWYKSKMCRLRNERILSVQACWIL